VESKRARQWLARVSLALVAAAFVVLLAFAGRRGLWLVLLTAGTAAVVVAALFWFLLQRGPLRWLALALAVGAPVAVLVVFAADRLLWVAVLAAVVLAAGIGRPGSPPRTPPCDPIRPSGRCALSTPRLPSTPSS